jgi:thiamine transport system permease protein
VAVRASTLVPFVVSPVAVAFGLLLLYPSWTASLALLVAAYALLAYPFVGQHVANALDALPPHWHQAARTLGASPWRVFVRVTLPLVAPALRRGMAFAAATALGEFAVSLFLSRPEWTTLTTLIYQHLGRPGADNLHAAHAPVAVADAAGAGGVCVARRGQPITQAQAIERAPCLMSPACANATYPGLASP